jgi:hypothetical protein
MVLKYPSMLMVPKYPSMLMVPKYPSMLMVPKYQGLLLQLRAGMTADGKLRNAKSTVM